MTREVWKPVVGHEGRYEVSDRGRVRSLVREKARILAPKRRTTGYLFVVLCSPDGGRAVASIHRLVACAYIPNPDGKPQVNHLDGDKTNNAVSNLQWTTHLENVRHAITTGLASKRGAANPRAKLTDDDVKAIRERLTIWVGRGPSSCLHRPSLIARDHGVTIQTICNIRSGKTWAAAAA